MSEPEPDLFSVFVRPLHRAGLRYMITGSIASMHYGEPRFTMGAQNGVTSGIRNFLPSPAFFQLLRD